jgi:tetratricopeptide (TPR) repeat protein
LSTLPDAQAIAPAGPQRFSRGTVLLTCIGLLLVFFAFTAFLARLYQNRMKGLADEWFGKGEASFQSQDFAGALTDYRNALVYSPNNGKIQFHLARALSAAGRVEEARSYLVTLLSESPGSGEINLELGRIAARQGAMTEASRYYHAAIYGVWETDPIAMRWRVRRELCEFLLDHGAANQAVADVIQLADNTPPDDIEGHKITGNLLLRAQLWPRALSEFRSALTGDPRDAEALKGAGTAAFQLGQYSLAMEFLGRLPRDQAADEGVAQMIETSREVLTADPFLPGLPAEAKARRAAGALSFAESRVQECAGRHDSSRANSPLNSDLQKAYAKAQGMKVSWSERNLFRHPDRVDAVMSLVFQMENLAMQVCGPPQGENYALWLLGRSGGINPR